MKKWAATPYLIWCLLFILVPLVLVLVFSFIEIDTTKGQVIGFTFENYERFMEPIYIKVLLRSLKLAILSTLICLLLGYPMAMILSNMEEKVRNILILLFVLPMWMNFLLRTYAWMAILGKNGFINTFLKFLHLPALNLLYNERAVIIGMVYNFLPFMVLPIYTVLIKMDKALLEAAGDLGANRVMTFIKVIFPLSVPGIISGITMVFMPAVSTFVISRLLGGGQYVLIGNLVEQQFLVVGDWHFGSAISIVMMVMILISMMLMSNYDQYEDEGGGLW